MGTKTVYTCDNQHCLEESTEPEKWFSIHSNGNSISVVAFTPGLKAKTFCGLSCSLKFLSAELPKLHLPKVEDQPKETLSGLSDEAKDLKEFLNSSKVKEFLGGKEENPVLNPNKLKEFLYGANTKF